MTLRKQQRFKQTETAINLFIFLYFFIAIYKEIKKGLQKIVFPFKEITSYSIQKENSFSF
jgi:hypothetical protein